MARIETYENKTGINIAGVVRENTNDAVGQALTGLGRQGVAVGLHMQEEQEREQRRNLARAESMDNLRLQSALIEHEDRVQAFAMEKSASFTGEGADGVGFQDTVREFAKKDAELAIKDKFAARADLEEVQLRFGNSTHGVIRSVGEAELNQGLKFQGDITNKRVSSLTAKIATNPELYDEAAREFIEFTTSTNIGRPELQSRIAVVGLAKLQRARLEAVAARDPIKFREATAGAFAGSTVPDAPEHVRDVMAGAANAGVLPTTLLAIGQIESGLNPLAGRPKNKDGSDMSSAEGLFQVLSAKDTLDELGITEADKRDTKKVSAAVASYIKRQSDSMEKRGIEVTPGKQYMTWNLGPGVAAAVMSANPNDTIDSVVNRALRNKSPEFREKVLRNNPSLYRPGMTVGEVMQRYETKMADAAGRVSKYTASTNGASSDEQAKAYFEKVMPGGAPQLTAGDLGEVYEMAMKKSAELSREQQDLNLGAAIATGASKGDALNSDRQKALDQYVIKQGFANGLVEGDANAHLVAAKITDNAGFAPDAFVNAYSASMAGGDMKSKLSTYAALADLQARNPKAYDATKLPADDRSRANEYIALTTVSNLAPDDAVKRIDFYRSPEGKKQIDAQKAGLQTTRDAEVKALSQDDVIAAFDDSIWSTPKDTSGGFLATATDTYKDGYVYWRQQGRSEQEAKDLALSQLKRSWGSSRIADTSNTQTFMPFPPEKFYNASPGGDRSWITDQAKNAATSLIAERYPKLYASYAAKTASLVRGMGKVETDGGGEDALKKAIGIKLVPDLTTAHEVRANKAPSYRLVVRLPDGNYDYSDARFTPDQVQADREGEERFAKAQKKERSKLPPDPNSLDGIANSP